MKYTTKFALIFAFSSLMFYSGAAVATGGPEVHPPQDMFMPTLSGQPTYTGPYSKTCGLCSWDGKGLTCYCLRPTRWEGKASDFTGGLWNCDGNLSNKAC